jgi:hypothetical protein
LDFEGCTAQSVRSPDNWIESQTRQLCAASIGWAGLRGAHSVRATVFRGIARLFG